jgi:hypothetical protein
MKHEATAQLRLKMIPLDRKFEHTAAIIPHPGATYALVLQQLWVSAALDEPDEWRDVEVQQ